MFHARLIALLLAGVAPGLSGCAARDTYMGIPLHSQAVPENIRTLAGRAREGDKDSQLLLGIAFEKGRGVRVDYRKAEKLYRLAAADSGGTVWSYSPPVSKYDTGQALPIDRGPKVAGLQEAAARLARLPTSWGTLMEAPFPPIPAERFHSAQPPFTIEVFWARLRSLLMAYEGEISPLDVEQALGVDLIMVTNDDGSAIGFQAEKKPEYWYDLIYLSYNVGTGRPGFNLDWKPSAFKDRDLRKGDVKYLLRNTKWKKAIDDDFSYFNQDLYCYNGHSLRVRVNGDLVVGISLSDRIKVC